MTEAIAQDPVFQEMAKEMQAAMGGLNLAGEDAGEAGADGPAAGGMPAGMPAVDPAKYMQAMERVMQNTEFLAAAESLGRGLMSQALSPEDQMMLETFQNPANQAALKKRLEDLKEDPELTEFMSEIESGGNEALMKYMNNPEIMAKVGKKFQEAMNDPEFRAQLEISEGAAAALEGGEEEEGVEAATPIIGAASAGDAETLKKLVAEKDAGIDDRDEEGRTALHFAAGYDEVECMKILLDAGADINAQDQNGNTVLHYSAGYGAVEATKILLEKGADESLLNEDKKTALEVAQLNEATEVVKTFAAKNEA